MPLYADISTTGYNLMDMTRSDLILIRDSLVRAGQSAELDRDTRMKILQIVKEIDQTVLSAKSKI